MTAAEPPKRDAQRALPIAAAERLPEQATPTWLRMIAFGLALSAHAGLLYALATPKADTLAGGGGQQLDAISVTLVSSAALESLSLDIAQPQAPVAAGAVEANEGAVESTPTPEQHDEKEAEDLEARPEPGETAALVPIPREEQEQDRKQPSRSTHSPAGGNTSRGDAATAAPRTAPAAASAGAVREYARYITQALAKAKPKGVGTFGTVKVKLVIAPSGGLAAVEVAKSSGNTRLDAMAIAAVQHAMLPVPPPGLTATQLTYEVPYHFR